MYVCIKYVHACRPNALLIWGIKFFFYAHTSRLAFKDVQSGHNIVSLSIYWDHTEEYWY